MFKNAVIAVLGSPSFTDEALLAHVLDYYVKPGQTVLTNEAGGTSLLTQTWCRTHQVPFQVISSVRDKFGWAMWAENTKIAQKCDAIIVFWDGKSVSAIDAVWKADMLDKRTLIVYVGQATPAEWKARLSQRFLQAS